jgi:probable HAF family extracellular repeat protein
MRTQATGLATWILTVAVVLHLAGSRADADALYQLTDLGPASNANPGASTTFNAVALSDLFPVRVDSSGQVTSGSMGPLDLSKASAIQAAYPIRNANVFPAVGDSQYQVGWISGQDSRSSWQAFVWNGQSQSGTALGAAPPAFGQPGYGQFSEALGVSNAGHVVGALGNQQDPQSSTAVTWGPTSDGSDPLAPLHSQLGTFSQAIGINSHDQIVGLFQSYTNPHAFLFTGNQLMDLNSLIPTSSGWTLLSATGINDQGQIAGYGTGPGGALERFLLTPDPAGSQSPTNPGSPADIPEPSTLACFGLGTAALLLWRCRKSIP